MLRLFFLANIGVAQFIDRSSGNYIVLQGNPEAPLPEYEIGIESTDALFQQIDVYRQLNTSGAATDLYLNIFLNTNDHILAQAQTKAQAVVDGQFLIRKRGCNQIKKRFKNLAQQEDCEEVVSVFKRQTMRVPFYYKIETCFWRTNNHPLARSISDADELGEEIISYCTVQRNGQLKVSGSVENIDCLNLRMCVSNDDAC